MRPIDLQCCVEVQYKNAEADNQIGPRGESCGRNEPGSNNRDICQRIVSSGEERCTGQASTMGSETGETKGTEQIDRKRTQPGKREGHRRRRNKEVEFLPRRRPQ